MDHIIELIEKGKIKRYFRSRGKLDFEGALTHVTQHASGRDPLFLEESDYLHMLHLIKKASERFKLKVLSFVLMPNHLHILMKLCEANLKSAMKYLFQLYAIYFNNKYDRKGHVFCGAYRSALCFDDIYLIAASLYIHLNPVRRGLAINPADYRWSSCGLFVTEVNFDAFVDYRFILNIIDDNIDKARRAYKELLSRMETNRIEGILDQPKALENIVDVLIGSNITKKYSFLSNVELDKIIKELHTKKRLRSPQEIKARRFLIEQLRARGFNITEIAKKLRLSRQLIHNFLR